MSTLENNLNENESKNENDKNKTNVLPEADRFAKGDIVKMIGLKSKSHWNDKLATVIGEFQKAKGRWPIQINFDDKSRALLRTDNLILQEMEYEEFEEEATEFQSNEKGPQCFPCRVCGAYLYREEAESGVCYYCEMKKSKIKSKK